MEKQSINFGWKYSPDFKEEYLEPDFNEKSFVTVDIPHANKEIPYNNFDEEMYQFVSCYRRTIEIPDDKKSKRVVLEFEAAANFAEVYIDGKLAFCHKGGYTAFKKDITELVNFGGKNVIAVKLDSRELAHIPPFGGVVDYLCYGGIYREVNLYFCEKEFIERIDISPIELLATKKTPAAPKASCKLFFNKELKEKPVNISICDAEGKEVAAATEKVSGAETTIVLNCPNAQLWSIENPALYTLTATLGKDIYIARFGFRHCRFAKKGFYLNGKLIKLRGLNRHQAYPYVGYAMPKSAQVADADFLKNNLGVNIVRTSHYPNSRHFLDRCDELGLLVFTEIPGWQHISKLEEWRDITAQHVEEMITQNFNHPSIILWGVRINESGDDNDLYARTNEIAHRLDKTRQTGGVRCIPFSNLLEDVFTYNDFVHSGKNRGLMPKSFVGVTGKPYLVTEYGGHIFPTKTFDHEKKRQEHALRHAKVLDAMYKTKGISGCIGWCMSDYNTHKDFGSGDKICYHGVSDMFRIEKLAAYTYKSQQSQTPVLELGSNMEIGDNAGGQVGDVYIFSNCDSLNIYKNGEKIGEIDLVAERKKSNYKHMPCPPILLIDTIGNQLETKEGYPKKDAEKLKRSLLAIKKYGTFGGIFKHPIGLLSIMAKRGLGIQEITMLFGKYATTWGAKQVTFGFEGVKDGKPVIMVEKGSVHTPSLYVKADASKLVEADTYDTVRIVLKALSQCGNVLPYSNDIVKIETDDKLSVIGPKEFALLGGQRGVWLKTTGKSGTAKVKITSPIGEETLTFEVEKI